MITDYALIIYQNMSQEPTITIKELDSYISETINQLRSSAKQPNDIAIFNLLLEKLGAIAINKEQLIERLKSDSHLPIFFIIFFNDSPSKVMENAFYFILKTLLVLKIFKFLS